MSKDAFRIYREALAGLWGPNYWVTWRPGTRLRLGDVGVVANGEFERVTDAAKLGLAFAQRPESAKERLDYTTSGQVEVTFKAAGSTPPGFASLAAADAGALISFRRADAVLVSLEGMRERQIDDLATLARQLVTAYALGQWEPKFVLVTTLVTASSGTIVLSGGAGSRLELRAAASVGAGPTTLAHLSTGLAVASASGVGLNLVAEGGLTPFFRVLRLRRSWLGRVREDFGAPQTTKGYESNDVDLASAADELAAAAAADPSHVVEELDQLDTLE